MLNIYEMHILCISFLVQYRIYFDSMIIYKMKKRSITDE